MVFFNGKGVANEYRVLRGAISIAVTAYDKDFLLAANSFGPWWGVDPGIVRGIGVIATAGSLPRVSDIERVPRSTARVLVGSDQHLVGSVQSGSVQTGISSEACE